MNSSPKLDGLIDPLHQAPGVRPAAQRRRYVSPHRTELNVMQETRSGDLQDVFENVNSHILS